ncbi:MAG: extracellular solute-binding protein [Blautia marasmi]
MEEDPSLEIQLDYAENEAYKTKIKAAVAANEAPDIYGTWGGGFTKPFVEADKVLQIDEYMTDDIKGQLLPGVLDYFTFEDKLYGLPTKCLPVIYL